MCKKYTRKDYSMKENERLNALEKIKELEFKRKEYQDLKCEYEMLIRDPKVERAISLRYRIYLLQYNVYLNDIEGENINDFAFNNSIDYNECNHDIWIYSGSYSNCRNNFDYLKSPKNIPNEQNEEFLYNVYVCLDCNKRLEVKDYKKFESEHLVLKNYQFTDVEKIRKIYFKMLRTLDCKSVSKKLIKDFRNGMIL